MTGQEIKAIRKELGYSQETFARLLGYSHLQRISEIETGKMRPPQAVLIILSHLQLLSRIAANTECTDQTK